MTTSQYEHIATGKVFELKDSIASGLSGFRKVVVAESKPTSRAKPKATVTNSSKEGNK